MAGDYVYGTLLGYENKNIKNHIKKGYKKEDFNNFYKKMKKELDKFIYEALSSKKIKK